MSNPVVLPTTSNSTQPLQTYGLEVRKSNYSQCHPSEEGDSRVAPANRHIAQMKAPVNDLLKNHIHHSGSDQVYRATNNKSNRPKYVPSQLERNRRMDKGKDSKYEEQSNSRFSSDSRGSMRQKDGPSDYYYSDDRCVSGDSVTEKDKNMLDFINKQLQHLEISQKVFDICKPEEIQPLRLNPSLLVRNKGLRKQREVGQQIRELRPGMILMKNYFLLNEQVEIIKKCRELGIGPGGFYRPSYADGAKLHLWMMCLGKSWDPERSYSDKCPFDGAKPPGIPDAFNSLVERAMQDAHGFLKNFNVKYVESILPNMKPDICIVNFYAAETGKLGLHQDKDESKESIERGLPVVSFSFGESAEFLYGDKRDINKAERVQLDSGDVLIFGGKSRNVFHGVSHIIKDTSPRALLDDTRLRRGRLNLTFRQY